MKLTKEQECAFSEMLNILEYATSEEPRGYRRAKLTEIAILDDVTGECVSVRASAEATRELYLNCSAHAVFLKSVNDGDIIELVDGTLRIRKAP